MPVPILHPVKIDGWRGRYIVLGHANDRHGGNCWVVKATPGATTACNGWVAWWRPDWNGGARGVRIDRCTPIVPKSRVR